MKALLESGEEVEMEYALRITTQLAFNEENAKWIDEKLQKLLDTRFVKHANQKFRDGAAKLKWVIEQSGAPGK